jgi:hypothetical protein
VIVVIVISPLFSQPKKIINLRMNFFLRRPVVRSEKFFNRLSGVYLMSRQILSEEFISSVFFD